MIARAGWTLYHKIGIMGMIISVPKNKPCKRNNRQISDNTKIAAKQGNAEERPDAGCEIKTVESGGRNVVVFQYSTGYLQSG